jgi:hypothetical protein
MTVQNNKNLALFPFDTGLNIATSQTGWFLNSGSRASFVGFGRITGNATGNGFIGISNAGLINAGQSSASPLNPQIGKSEIIGSSKVADPTFIGTLGFFGSSSSLGINNTGTINTSYGNDSITGTGTGINAIGINNTGTINTFAGNDTITGQGFDTNNTRGSIGIVNSGTIDTGIGNDTITGIGTAFGIVNINTFSGMVKVATGTITTGDGDDTITGNRIFNDGNIFTGFGNDTIDTLKRGFAGNGLIDLGAGNDTLKGFGTGTFLGNSGSDKILFDQGRYTISGSRITSGGLTMNVSSFEQIGGANGGLFNFGNGTFDVNQSGFMTKVA